MDIKNILSKEDSKVTVTYGDLVTFIENVLKPLIEEEDKTDKLQWETIDSLVDAVTDSTEKIEYKRLRDVYYFIEVISQLNNVPKKILLDNYHKYCAEFDELNKKENQGD